MEVKLWVALAVIGILIPIIGFAINWAVKQITEKLDQIIKQNAEFRTELVRQNSELVNMKEDIVHHRHKLHEHAGRIRTIELDHAKGCFQRED